MEREIIYRGKRCSDDEWVYGFYVESQYSWQGHKPHRSWIVPNAISNGGFFNVLGRYAVKDDTVGQFTGLYDKKGVKIFEGDIVLYNDTFDSDYVKYDEKQKVEFIDGCFYPISEEWCQDIKVIGNIHDNVELLAAK